MRNFANPELVFELTDIRSVPEPGTAGLMLLGLFVGVSAPAAASPYPSQLIARGRIARCRRLPMWQHRGGRIV